MTPDITKERLIRFLQATPEQLAAIDRVLAERMTERAESGKQKAEIDAGCRMPEPLITKQRLAEIVGVHERTVEQWMRRGVVSYLKVGGAVRFRWSEVDRELDARCWVRRRAKARGESGKRSAEPTHVGCYGGAVIGILAGDDCSRPVVTDKHQQQQLELPTVS